MPTAHSFGIPNFPHFRLYDLPGSPCDTLGINGSVGTGEPASGSKRVEIVLYPVPASEILTVQFEHIYSGQWTITDLAGRTLLTGTQASGVVTMDISVSSLLPGTYALTFRASDGRWSSRLFTVISR
jgi:hypothetical protein